MKEMMKLGYCKVKIKKNLNLKKISKLVDME